LAKAEPMKANEHRDGEVRDALGGGAASLVLHARHRVAVRVPGQVHPEGLHAHRAGEGLIIPRDEVPVGVELKEHRTRGGTHEVGELGAVDRDDDVLRIHPLALLLHGGEGVHVLELLDAGGGVGPAEVP